MGTVWRVQCLRMLTSARQSATRPRLVTGSATKVPLEQSAGSRSGMVGPFCAPAAKATSSRAARRPAVVIIAYRVTGFGILPVGCLSETLDEHLAVQLG